MDVAADPAKAAELGVALDTIRHSLHAIDETGRTLVGADAVAFLMRQTPGQRWLGRLMDLPVLRPIARYLYDRFADRLFAWNRRHGRW
jgi:predicted DCC family thiol-disulfide oxidoreductase YuxK